VTKPPATTALKHDFSQAFTQACSVAAIADSRSANETLEQLLLQCFVILDDPFSEAKQLQNATDVLFGLRIAERQVEERISHLLELGQLQRPFGSQMIIEESVRAKVTLRIETSRALEERVKKTWIEELGATQAARCVALHACRDLVRSTTLFHWWPQRLRQRQVPR
jgi:hypothetical protein